VEFQSNQKKMKFEEKKQLNKWPLIAIGEKTQRLKKNRIHLNVLLNCFNENER